MMSIRFFLRISILFLYFLSNAQEPIKIDTVETIITDSSITYVIKRTPVKIIEKVEIEKPKVKKNFYLSIGLSVLACREIQKASPGHEDFAAKVISSMGATKGYSVNSTLYRCPQKISMGLSVGFQRLFQEFKITDQEDVTYTTYLLFNSSAIGGQYGYWFKKADKTSFLIAGGAGVEILLSYSGFMHDKSGSDSLHRISLVVSYRQILPYISIHPKLLFNRKNYLIELEPYFVFIPTSATRRKEYYTARRSYVGIRVNLTNKLF